MRLSVVSKRLTDTTATQNKVVFKEECKKRKGCKNFHDDEAKNRREERRIAELITGYC